MRAGPAGFFLAAGRPICRLSLGGRAADLQAQAGRLACRLFLGGRAADLQAFSWRPGGF